MLKEAVTWLQAMGVTVIRQGGSFTQGDYYLWKNWRGPVYERPSIGAEWGASLVGGWCVGSGSGGEYVCVCVFFLGGELGRFLVVMSVHAAAG